MISMEQYLGPYKDHPDVTQERRDRAFGLLVRINALIEVMAREGVVLPINPHTGCELGGNGNGGFRPQDCPIGAARSSHKEAQGIDIFDPKRVGARWVLRNEERVVALGLVAMEDPRWTPSWTHLQTRVVPGKFCFIPSSAPPLAAALPEQTTRIA